MNKITIRELTETESYDELRVVERDSGASLDADDVMDAECDWEMVDLVEEEHDDRNRVVIRAFVKPEKEIRYLHIGAPAPQYAINSLSKVRSCLSYIASAKGLELRTERHRDMTADIFLKPDTNDEQVETLFRECKEYMEENDYTGVDVSAISLRYDAAYATLETSGLTRNW